MPERPTPEPTIPATHDSQPPLRTRRGRTWEQLVIVHVSVLVVGLSWSFGGQIGWARDGLLAWGTIGMALFFLLRASTIATAPDTGTRPLSYLWPLALFDLLVLVSCFNPSTRVVMHEGAPMYQHIPPAWAWLPSSARPDLSLRELWQFNAIVLSCFNVFQAVLRRSALRKLLVVLVANGMALAIFGTFQKLLQAEGLWFGLVASPNPYFFATFVYHNHWGPFTMLNVAAGAGLLFHAWRRGGYRDLWHSPVLMGIVVLLLLAAAVPLSGSRSSSAMIAVLLLAALTHVLVRVIRRRRERHESVVLPIGGIVLAATLAIAAIVYIGQDVISSRAAHTARQLEQLQQGMTWAGRAQLYADTWRMATERPLFGWGLESFADVFSIYNSVATPPNGWKPFYAEAHNDWLQAFAEVGIVGLALLAILVWLPLRTVRWNQIESHIPRYLLVGCGLLLLYAGVEFPFANPTVMASFWLCLHVAARYARQDLGSRGS